MFLGKLIGVVLGYLMLPPLGAFIGLFIGHLFDKGYQLSHLRASPERLQAIQDCFFETTFTLLGHLAKADGRISEQEIAQTEALMAQMGLTAEHRKAAINLFKQGADAGFQVDQQIAGFRETCGNQANLIQMLVVYLVNVALADGDFDPAEEAIVRRVAGGLGIPQFAFDRLIQMIKAQNAFRGGHYHEQAYGGGVHAAPSANALNLAYEALGVSSDSSDAEIKRAYRKLMSQYHPDKLTGQGVPQDMINEATERSQEIQAAYDLIKKFRGK